MRRIDIDTKSNCARCCECGASYIAPERTGALALVLRWRADHCCVKPGQVESPAVVTK